MQVVLHKQSKKYVYCIIMVRFRMRSRCWEDIAAVWWTVYMKVRERLTALTF